MTAFIISAPTPITFDDGKTYLLSPPTERDLFTLLKYLRKQKLADILDAMPKDFTDAERAVFIREAVAICDGEEVNTSIFADPYSVEILCWLGLRKNHANLTLDAVRKLLESDANMKTCMETYAGSTSVGDPKKDAKKK